MIVPPEELDERLIAAQQRVDAITHLIDRANGRWHDRVRDALVLPLETARQERNRLYKALQERCGD